MSSQFDNPIAVTAITVSMSAVLIRGQLRELKSRGFEPILVSSPGKEVEGLAESEGILLAPVPMRREASPIHDLVSLARLIRLFGRVRPTIVNAGTPKAGLLCVVAAWFSRVPIRIYTLHGLCHESFEGFRRALQKAVERIACGLAHQVVCVSPSVKQVAVSERLLRAKKAIVLGRGSCGIELNKFQPELVKDEDRTRLRRELGIPSSSRVLGFVGRLIPRKGVAELVQAWSTLRRQHPDVWLLLVGPREDAQALDPNVIKAIEEDDRILETGLVNGVPPYMAIMNVLALPSHWEGFGNVLVEAASMGIPVVTTNGTGTQDAVSDGVNGRIVAVRDVPALTAALDGYLSQPVLMKAHGTEGRRWAKQFDRKFVASHLADLYQGLLEENQIEIGRPVSAEN